MSLNDNAVYTAASGYIYKAPIGTAMPTREQITSFDADTFGTQAYKLVIDGADGGEFTVSVGGSAAEPVAFNATAGEIQTALEAVAGAGNVIVSDTDGGFTIALVGDLFGQETEVTVSDTLTPGSATAEVIESAKASPWEPVGHTSLEELPEFGYDGGDTEVKGTWQKKKLREVMTDELIDYVVYRLVQFDEETLAMYYGKNVSNQPGIFGYDGKNEVVESAFLMVIVDGPRTVAMTAAKASTRREDAMEMEQDEYMAMPVRSTFLDHPGRNLFDWIFPTS